MQNQLSFLFPHSLACNKLMANEYRVVDLFSKLIHMHQKGRDAFQISLLTASVLAHFLLQPVVAAIDIPDTFSQEGGQQILRTSQKHTVSPNKTPLQKDLKRISKS